MPSEADLVLLDASTCLHSLENVGCGSFGGAGSCEREGV
jgi:hypothetical protein